MMIASNAPDPNATRAPVPTPTATAIPTEVPVAYEFVPSEHLVTTAPFDVPGYTLVQRLGQPVTPATPVDVVVLTDGTTLVADAGVRRVLAFDAQGTLLPEWGDLAEMTAGAQLLAMERDAQNNVYVLTDYSLLRRFRADGTYDASWTFDIGHGPGMLSDVVERDIFTISPAGDVLLYLEGPLDTVVLRISSDATRTQQAWELDDCLPRDLAVAADDVVYANCGSSVLRLNNAGAGSLATPSANADQGSVDVYLELPGHSWGMERIIPGADGTTWVLHAGDPTTDDWRSSAASSYWMMQVDANGSIQQAWETNVPAITSWFPIDVYVDGAGLVYIPNSLHGGVSVYTADGELLRTLLGQPRPDALLRTDAMTVAPDGTVTVLDMATRSLVHFDAHGTFLMRTPLPDTVRLPEDFADTLPLSIFGGMMGRLLATAAGAVIVQMAQPTTLTWVSPDGEDMGSLTLSGDDEFDVTGMDVDHEGTVWLVNDSADEILLLRDGDPTGWSAWLRPDGEPPFDIGDVVALSAERAYVVSEQDMPNRDDEFNIHGIRTLTRDGDDLGFLVTFMPDTQTEGGYAEGPALMAADASGTVYAVTLRFQLLPENTFSNLDGSIQPEWFLRVFSPDGALLTSASLGDDLLNVPHVDVSADGSRLYLSDPTGHQVLVYERNGE